MSKILKLIDMYRVVSIIGMAKNSGKTTVLNHIISKVKGDYTLGLTSIGRDGEDFDLVTYTDKPRIFIKEGSFVATAKKGLFNSDITKEIIETTGINTPMGEVIISKALSSGYVDLAGPSINIQIKEITLKLLKLKCDKVFIDGALSRKTQASPAVSDAVILATGASVSRNIDKTVESTAFTVEILSTEVEEDDNILSIVREIFKVGKIGVIYKNNDFKILEFSTSLDASKKVIDNLDNVSYVAIKGAISDKFIDDIMKSTKKYKGVTFIVEDGTKIFLNYNTFLKFIKSGGIIKVADKINIICVTANPVSPYGYMYDSKEFLNKLRDKIRLPVFDILGGDDY